MTAPTARQAEIVAEYRRLGHSQAEAARSLGIAQGGVRSAILGYERHTGETVLVTPVPRPPRPPREPRQTISQRRLAQIYAEVRQEVTDKLRAEYDLAYQAQLDRTGAEMDRALGLATYLEQLVGRIERAVVPASHRRIADGGQGARRERRRRGAAA